MTSMRQRQADVLDSLLRAGSDGEPLQPRHLPHLGATKLLVMLPAILVGNSFHLAEVDFGAWRIHYKHIAERNDLQLGECPRYMTEANQYAASQWGHMFAQYEPSCIRQGRERYELPAWSVFDQNSDFIMRTVRTCEFMELAGICKVLYDE